VDLREIGMDWIDLAKVEEQWRVLVNRVIKLYLEILE
jgi:hypothetical protein